jgi:hypothetical protein
METSPSAHPDGEAAAKAPSDSSHTSPEYLDGSQLPRRSLTTELERRERISDMMLTMHAVLRDRYSRLATSFDIALVSAGTALCATTFLDPRILLLVGVSPDEARLVLGALSVIVFLLSLVGLRVDWKERSARHRDACKSLSDLKMKCRELSLARPEIRRSEGPEFLRAAAFVTSELQPIPDSQFPSLKARHKLKLELSRLLDCHPGVPVWILRCRVRWVEMRNLLGSEAGNQPIQNLPHE